MSLQAGTSREAPRHIPANVATLERNFRVVDLSGTSKPHVWQIVECSDQKNVIKCGHPSINDMLKFCRHVAGCVEGVSMAAGDCKEVAQSEEELASEDDSENGGERKTNDSSLDGHNSHERTEDVDLPQEVSGCVGEQLANILISTANLRLSTRKRPMLPAHVLTRLGDLAVATGLGWLHQAGALKAEKKSRTQWRRRISLTRSQTVALIPSAHGDLLLADATRFASELITGEPANCDSEKVWDLDGLPKDGETAAIVQVNSQQES